jgi:hypothetical protein
MATALIECPCGTANRKQIVAGQMVLPAFVVNPFAVTTFLGEGALVYPLQRIYWLWQILTVRRCRRGSTGGASHLPTRVVPSSSIDRACVEGIPNLVS